jgi:predicted phosphodiesterase
MSTISRRCFLTATTAGLVGVRLINWDPRHASAEAREVRFGVSTDIHKDVIHDPDERLQTYIDDMSTRDLDYIIDLGDFCQPKEENAGFRDIFDSYDGPKYHVLGNHDNDGGHSWKETMDFYGMGRPYYAFDVGGYHFVVLDGNNKHKDAAPGYPRYINRRQLKWLEANLAKTERHTFVFSHQSLRDCGSGCVENFAEVQAVLEGAGGKVKVCFCGHRHVDEQVTVNGIHYVDINSMSYYWVGAEYEHARFSEEVEEAFPYVSYTVPYDTPLWAVITIRPEGELIVEGRSGAFIPPTPQDLGMNPTNAGGATLSAAISDCTIPIAE